MAIFEEDLDIIADEYAEDIDERYEDYLKVIEELSDGTSLE